MEHSAVHLTCIKIPNGFQAFVLSIFEWPFKTGFTVSVKSLFKKVHVQLPSGTRDTFLVGAFIFYHTFCMQAAKALERLDRCPVALASVRSKVVVLLLFIHCLLLLQLFVGVLC